MRSDLEKVARVAAEYLESLEHRSVGAVASPEELLARLRKPLPTAGMPPADAIRELIADVDGGLVASAGPRYFGFVIGGTTPGSVMADWLTTAWDQNAQVHATSPAAAAIETVIADWLVDLLDLPAGSSLGLTTGCQMANFTGLLCGRNAVLERSGWDVASKGLFGAPPLIVLLSDESHATVRSALPMIGIGVDQVCEIASDDQGCMKPDAFEREVRRHSGRPMLVSLQAGNVHTGAFEPVGEIADRLSGENAWIHVDGAFGLWAAVSARWNAQRLGMERADSWATDAHKWLNVPYDSGLIFVKDPASHRSIKSSRCGYAGPEEQDRRDGSSWVPENSRRARGFVLYAAIRELGRDGIREMVERCCDLAQGFAQQLPKRIPGARVLNDVVLNQVLFRLTSSAGVHERFAERLQSDGHCWLGTTHWKGRSALRLSVCSRATTQDDIESTLDAMAEAWAACGAVG